MLISCALPSVTPYSSARRPTLPSLSSMVWLSTAKPLSSRSLRSPLRASLRREQTSWLLLSTEMSTEFASSFR